MSGKKVSSQESCALQKSDIDRKRITDQKALSDEKICLRSSGFQDSRKHPGVFKIGKKEAEYRRKKHDSYIHKKSKGETRSSMKINPSSESSPTSGNASKSSSMPANILNQSALDEKSSNSDDRSTSKDFSSTEESSFSTKSESTTWIEKSQQPDLDVAKEERKMMRRRIRHKYSGKTVLERIDQTDGEESTKDVKEGLEESSS